MPKEWKNVVHSSYSHLTQPLSTIIQGMSVRICDRSLYDDKDIEPETDKPRCRECLDIEMQSNINTKEK
jgi:hypothetical protein